MKTLHLGRDLTFPDNREDKCRGLRVIVCGGKRALYVVWNRKEQQRQERKSQWEKHEEICSYHIHQQEKSNE